MNDYRTERVLAGRIRMHIMDWPGGDPPLLFLHSLTDNGLAALQLGQLLTGRRRLIAPDLRGRGQSDVPFGDYGIPVHIKDAIACMDRLEIERFVAVGHSFGAMISLNLAAMFPNRVIGLILFDGGAVPGAQAQATLDAYYDNLQYHFPSIEAYINRFRRSSAYQPWTQELDILARSNLYQQPDQSYIRHVARYVVDADRQAERDSTWRRLPDLYREVHCPVLIIRAGMGMSGSEDQVLPDSVVALMLEGMPTAQVITIPQASHTSLLTIPSAERNKAVLNFLGLSSEDS